MKITHHPEPESLMSCSAGSMPEAFAAVMATHISMCPCCRKDLSILEHVGAALFDSLVPTSVVRPAPVIGLRASEAGTGEVTPATSRGDVPSALLPVIGEFLNDVPWTRLSPGVWQHQIALSDGDRGDLRLIKVSPGYALPEHGHSGSEITLVLRGSYRDATGVYRTGDVADLSEEVEHAPLADAVEGCICLIATDGKLKFKSRIARFVQPLFGL